MLSASGVSAGVLTAVDSFRPTLVPRTTGHQATLFGLSVAAGYGAGAAARRLLAVAGLRHPLMVRPGARAALAVGATALTTPIMVRRAKQEHAAHLDWGKPPMDPVTAAAGGTALAAGLVLAVNGTATGVRALAAQGSTRVGGPAPVWGAAAVVAGAGAVRLSTPAASQLVLRRLATDGTTPDPAFRQPPDNPSVSGGPGSLVPYGTHAREGSRFVHLAARAEEIAAVTGTPAMDPIRVFIGVGAAAGPQEQVDLAVAELERLGAFERSCILAVSPAGTGYANTVPVEALELFTGGDCATVTIQYGVLPSMFSLGLVPEAARVYRMLIDALRGRAGRLYSYGESLGADAAQAALLAEPSLLRPDGTFEEIDGALYAGTPAGTGVRGHVPDVHALPGALLLDRWEQLPVPPPEQVRTWLLDHDADPVTKFRRRLIWSEPEWMRAEPRGRGVPQEMRWRPLLTWLQVGFDVAHATQSKVGQFQSLGHDYRADLAPLVRAAFAPQASPELIGPVQDRLAASEQRRAELLAQR